MTTATLPPPAAAAAPTGAEARRRTVLTGLGIGLYFGGFCVAALFAPGTPFAVALVAIQFMLYGAYLIRYRDGLIGRLLLAGLVLGFVELPGDWFAWRFGGLRYPGDSPLLASPLYMPFAYVPAMLQFGYIAWWAAQRWSLPKAGLVPTSTTA